MTDANNMPLSVAECVDALRLMVKTYPYNPPCYGWQEQVAAHKAARAVLAKWDCQRTANRP